MSHQDLSKECLESLEIGLNELHSKWCAICTTSQCVHAGSDRWHQRMVRQTGLAEGPNTTDTDLERFPGLARFETVGQKTIVQVPAAYEMSSVIVTPHNTPNPGKVVLPGAPTAPSTPAHFQSKSTPRERKVKPGATVQLDD